MYLSHGKSFVRSAFSFSFSSSCCCWFCCCCWWWWSSSSSSYFPLSQEVN